MNRFLVAQVGARRSYAVPAALDQAGMLDALYTDICANQGVGRLFCSVSPAYEPESIRSLRGRRIPVDILQKTRSFGSSALRYEWLKILSGGDAMRRSRALARFGEELGQSMARAGFGDATHLYTFLGDVTPLLEAARARNVVTVTDIYAVLSAELIVARERKRYPDFESDPPAAWVQGAFEWLRRVIALTDWLIMPSAMVRDDLVENFGVDPERCLVVPYAVNDTWFDVPNEPVAGRILFVGNAVLGKGIHTLGQAALMLGNGSYNYSIVGNATTQVRTHPLTRELTFKGRIPRLDVAREYESADVLVLPSLAEGAAAVVYEALAAGIPVVTTMESGSVVRDGIEGYIVPASDPEALASKIRQIVEDRSLRARMSAAARLRARDFTWSRYSERLSAALGNLPSRHES